MLRQFDAYGKDEGRLGGAYVAVGKVLRDPIVLPIDPFEPGDAARLIAPPPPASLMQIITSPPEQVGCLVRVFSGAGEKLKEFTPYIIEGSDDQTGSIPDREDDSHSVMVGTGDITGDGLREIVTGQILFDVGSGTSEILGFNAATGQRLWECDTFAGSVIVGTSVATGDFNRDGRADVLAGSAPIGREVKIFNGVKLAEAMCEEIDLPLIQETGREAAIVLVGETDNDTLMGEGGHDVMFGDDGVFVKVSTLLPFETQSPGVLANPFSIGLLGNLTQVGLRGDIILQGRTGDDEISGADGDDVVIGDSGVAVVVSEIAFFKDSPSFNYQGISGFSPLTESTPTSTVGTSDGGGTAFPVTDGISGAGGTGGTIDLAQRDLAPLAPLGRGAGGEGGIAIGDVVEVIGVITPPTLPRPNRVGIAGRVRQIGVLGNIEVTAAAGSDRIDAGAGNDLVYADNAVAVGVLAVADARLPDGVNANKGLTAPVFWEPDSDRCHRLDSIGRCRGERPKHQRRSGG